MLALRCLLSIIFTGLVFGCSATDVPLSDDQPLLMPSVGASELRILTPTILELTLITTKSPDKAPQEWNFADDGNQLHLPSATQLTVKAGDKSIRITALGFKRRVLYAPFKNRDLRIANYLYLKLGSSLPDSQAIEVQNPDHKLWPAQNQFTAKSDPLRWSPVIHVNQTGYMASKPKQAMAGYFLGSLGELSLQEGTLTATGRPTNSSAASLRFQILKADGSNVVFQGELQPRADRGFPFESYQKVLQADFSNLKTPGEYKLFIPGLGTSYAFYIGDEVAGAFARAYALGIYHQRCGMPNELPFTRFTHGECHVAPAEIPTMDSRYESVNDSLKKETENYKENPRHTAPRLENVKASLYPFVNKGPVDVRGGHHDAGDYSKYTINSAGFIHSLVFAADVFPAVSQLDNLGLPESGDGKSDVLQEAKWETDFLAKMQDADGGFYFLVYPRDREYEVDVLPDHGDPQIVFPKTTSATAAATAALAQCASSPTFKKQFPDAAKLYLEKARKGWDFLDKAIAKYGKDGAYQKITHYGDEFMHDDELAWAACELFVATGEDKYHKKVLEWLKPDETTRKWGWLRLFDAYGYAIRDYAFAAKAGKRKREELDRQLLEQCENELAEAGQDQLKRASASAYGTSFPEETKRVRNAGWYFSSDAAFDLAVACQLDWPIHNDPRPKMMEALLSNLNYEEGCNPVNVTYLTGLGWKRQREIVHQYAQNDRRVLPLTGIPLGNIQAGFGWMDAYKKELGELSFPSDSDDLAAYPFYDRWGDSWNLTQEFVILNQAHALAYLAWLMAQSPLKAQSWKSGSAQISFSSDPQNKSRMLAKLSAPGLELNSARVVWEIADREPSFGNTLSFAPPKLRTDWIEAEAQLPDGRRVFAVTNVSPVTPFGR
ncbi:MAG TPA: glycoside hydrolase family 9 protein [Candidatus Dormibacteraeota bacterium]|nr:glycoside hydrolase family 9 protein [Candidatus Dormibacteraeota bacterium]